MPPTDKCCCRWSFGSVRWEWQQHSVTRRVFFQVMGEIAEMDIAMWEAGGWPDGSYEKPPRGAARGRWQRGFDYGGIRAHKYLVEKFLMNMVGMTFDDALATLRAYCAERGFEPPGKKKPYAHMARFIQGEFGAFRAWLIARGPYSRGG